MTKLRISESLSLPLDGFVTSTQMIVAKKRRGKSYLAQVQAEELLAARQQVVALDPTGAWWGLRSSADGKEAGYSIVVFGGDHADVPLEPTSGETVAEAIVAEQFSAVLDLTSMRKGERIRFGSDFLETLYRHNRAAMHLFIDEADVFAPQVTRDPQQARLLGATDELVRRGGLRGVGVTLITQRSQVVSKDVISQIDAMAVLQMNHPKDIAAVSDWMEANYADPDAIKAMLRSLPRQPVGTAWYMSPERDLFEQVVTRKKRTFDSGRTPKPGERVAAPKVLAPVDLARLGKTIAETVEQAKANDPKVLKVRIAGLEKQLAAKPSAKVETKTVEKPVITEAQIQRIGVLIEQGESLIKRWDDTNANAHEALAAVEKRVAAYFVKLGEQLGDMRRSLIARANIPAPPAPTTPRPATRNVAPVTTRRENVSGNIPGGDPALEPRLRKILGAIAWWEAIGVDAPDSTGVAFVAGYSPTSSGFEKARSTLRTLGLIEYPSSGAVQLTELGRRAAPVPERPSTNGDLHAAVLRKLEPRHGRLLTPLIAAYPDALDMQGLADASEYSATSSGFEKARGTLRSLGLVTYPRSGEVRASDLLFPEGP